MLVSEFDFDLPEELIAQEAAPRGASRLLVLPRDTGAVRHDIFAHVTEYFRAGDVLVVNDTKVFAARLIGRRVPSGGAVECLLVSPSTPQHPGAPPSPPQHPEHWEALMHPGQKLKPGALVRFDGPAGTLMAEVLERKFHGRRSLRLWAEDGGDIASLVDALGHVPLPPYIRRSDTPEDRQRYQTVYARARGSVAAPTAGLHFTPELLEALSQKGAERVPVTLHVGYGTFKPVRVERVEDHAVDPETYEISLDAAAAINRALDERRRVLAVGTTTTRALEDAALRGGGRIPAGPGQAALFIRPGHRFQVISGLVTNFHLPKSSLLMLVSAFAGRDRVLEAYREAIRDRYRFYSYGDAMLIC